MCPLKIRMLKAWSPNVMAPAERPLVLWGLWRPSGLGGAVRAGPQDGMGAL